MNRPNVMCEAKGDRCLGCNHYHGLADRCEYAHENFVFVGHCLQARDGSIGNVIAPWKWATYQKEYDKLANDPWVMLGGAKVVPVYISTLDIPGVWKHT